MAKGVKPRIKVPKQASAGEAITIKTLISHKMETGLRKDADGNKIPQSIINRFTCDFNGSNVVDFDMKAGISVNPYFQFEAVVPESGEFKFTWYDDDGSVYEKNKKDYSKLKLRGRNDFCKKNIDNIIDDFWCKSVYCSS